ncbi:GuaB1 family IMP dehydrogenase-related protein [Patescibacteria group bacterium]|nr:GuaB1 family IMP dehydrogenase-related protein [Patescibacteria group bacterium]
MKFLHLQDEDKELTYSDVFLMPQYSNVGSRMNVDIAPKSVPGMQIPIIVANMTAVAGRRMAETVARRGGLVVLPQDLSLSKVGEIVSYVKSCHHLYETAVVVNQTESVQTALNLIHKRAHKGVVIVDDEYRPVGIFTEKDAELRDRFGLISEAMTKDLVTVSNSANPQEIFDVLQKTRFSFVPVIDGDGKLVGVMTQKGVLRSYIYKPAVNEKGELLTAVAVGINGGLQEKLRALQEMKVDVIVLDTAHGHQQKMVEALKIARNILGSEAVIAAGNVASARAAEDLIRAGANIIKVGIGPGAMCITRMMTGVGRPQFSAVKEVSAATHSMGGFVWADGGIKDPRDVALAIAAGADCAFAGSLFAATYESPADMYQDEEGNFYKENFGMASKRAVIDRNRKLDAYEVAKREFFEEGISRSRLYLRSGSKSAEEILDKMTAGLRSACTYTGANSLKEFQEKAVIGVQTPSGYSEGKPRDRN